MSLDNPYAPPKDEGYIAPAAERVEGVVVCTFVLTEQELVSGLVLTAPLRRYLLPVYGAFIGFFMVASIGFGASLAASVVLGTLGWFLGPKLYSGNAKRAVANKTMAERSVTWRFSAEGYEVTTPHSQSRADWSTMHRFIDGPTSFVLYVSEAVVHVIPKRALHPDDVPVLTAMLASRITPRKKPRSVPAFVFVLWFLLVFMFFAVWQFLQTQK
jgi:hypothetical protein